ncbi:GNAT family N-acetyltransferase [Paenibacillus apiarius]|uniref:GNAT family N-acetyltransferase n=1 Tax=Paenibacillus apiarius TaxID=46240 RepID=A0ABT4DM21_9BACL|nr:GNAT family N-acetyltransferase [Paenibacillus apiarius]MCY9513734.1 GNAT family N-acetyltransferase [Paenibacillus apiarius]MCY9518285.1 GNAT family N-acetyltransferase [Paenibacillus apiarius]MCY9551314.1 GNAT family N-acetyltransferase [Paenibacillus apiarius]MCY9558468.1 GNAT family N-acetyltransferase [Paenibacillus apiarius]MCY9684218.1 GNAT family N-acetyltransferase [Paenibacillus apiarius]
MPIREMEPNDVATIAKFETDISVISFGEDAITDPQFHAKKLEKALRYEKKGMLVLEVDGNIAGWMWITPRENSVTKETYANFKSFYIEASYRGTDHVDELFEAGMAYCKGEGAVHIIGKVHVSNLPMRLLYKKYGFKPTHLTMELFSGEADD